MRLALAFVATLVLSWATGRTARADASSRLVYVRGPGAEQCPGEQAIRAAVRARLGYDPFFPWAHDALFVDVTHTGGTFHVELKLVDADNLQRGARSLSVKGADCAGVVDALALTISLTIDPDSVMRGPPPAPPPPAPPPAPPEPEAPAPSASAFTRDGPPAGPSALMLDPRPAALPRAPDPAEPPPPAVEALRPVLPSYPPPRTYLGAGVGVSTGAAPAVATGLAVFAGLRRKVVSLDIEGRLDLPATGLGSDGKTGVGSWIAAGSLVPCAHLGPAFGCAVGSLGRMTATSSLVGAETNVAVWSSAGARLGVEVPLSSTFMLRAWGEVLATLTRNKLLADSNPNPIYTYPPASGGAVVAVVWRIL